MSFSLLATLRRLLLAALLVSSATIATAQVPKLPLPPARNSTVRLGVDYLAMPEHVGARYQGQYARHILHHRVVVAGGIGYLNVANPYQLGGVPYVVQGRRIVRLTTDLTASYDFLRSTTQALRLGAGPSLWYCKDESALYTNQTVNPDGSLASVELRVARSERMNVGLSVLAEYELALGSRTALSTRVGVASIRNSGGGLTGILGLTLGYRL
jgi:hypothetical protein